MKTEFVERVFLTAHEQAILREAESILTEVYAIATIGRPLEKVAKRGKSAIHEILNSHSELQKEGK